MTKRAGAAREEGGRPEAGQFQSSGAAAGLPDGKFSTESGNKQDAERERERERMIGRW